GRRRAATGGWRILSAGPMERQQPVDAAGNPDERRVEPGHAGSDRRSGEAMTAIQDIPLTTISGGSGSLGDYAGQVLLVVNVASKCGLTPQYDGLEKLHEQYRDQGFSVLGFPANDFAGQEPGRDDEIAEFCRSTYGVEFPMFSKIAVL